MPDALIQYGVVALFVWAFAVQAGMPLPAVPILVGAGALSGSGRMNLVLAIVAAMGATLGADVLWYLLGRSLGTRVLATVCRFSLDPDSLIREATPGPTERGCGSRRFPGLAARGVHHRCGIRHRRRHGTDSLMLRRQTVSKPRGTATRPGGFAERFAKVNGVRLRYLVGGQGSAVVLLHGYAETGHMWRPIMPLLARHHTVVVPDLRGAGGSAKPESGYDKKNMAVDIHELTASLGLDRVRIVGHDIGLMVAYAYAAQFPEAT